MDTIKAWLSELGLAQYAEVAARGGKLHAKTSQREEASHHLATAMTLYREMEMRFWLQQVEAEMKGLV